jgi:transcriptional regulator with XRE-family HTH domain
MLCRKKQFGFVEGCLMDKGENYLSLRNRMFSDFGDLHSLWKRTDLKRQMSFMFARMRKSAGLSQKDIVERTGWDKSFVSRLEGAQGPLPEVQTIARFAEACNLVVGVVVCKVEEEGYARVVDAAPLVETPANFDQFQHMDIILKSGQ